MNGTDQSVVLTAVAGACRRQAHVIASRPNLLWQQLHAVLVWEEQPTGNSRLQALLESERSRRDGPGAPPWLSPLKCPEFVGPVSATFAGHEGAVTSCAPFPGGERLLSAAEDRTLRIWDVRSGRCESVIEQVEGRPTACAVSPSGRALMAAAADGTVRLWDGSGFPGAVIAGHEGGATSCTFLGNDRHVASGGADLTLRIWDVVAGGELASVRGHTDSVTCCVASSSGRLLATGGRDSVVCLWAWDGATSLTGEALGRHTDAVSACAIAPDDGLLASVGFDRVVRVWDLTSRTPTAEFEAHDDWILGCAFSPDGQRLATSSADGTVRVWDTGSWALVGSVRAHEDWVNACVFSHDGQAIMTASADNTLRSIAVAGMGVGEALLRHAKTVHRCAFSTDGMLAATGSLDGAVLVWDAVNGTPVASFDGGGAELRTLAFARGGLLAWGQDDGAIRLWDAATKPDTARTLEGHVGPVRHVAFSADGGLLAAAGDDKTVIVWDLHADERIATLGGHEGRVNACAISPDGALVAAASADRTARVWRTSSGDVLHDFGQLMDPAVSCAFSGDGSLLAVGVNGRRVVMWRMPSGERIGTLEAGSRSWALSPDGQSILCGEDGSLASWRIADVPFGTEVEFREWAFAREHAAVWFVGHRDWVNDCGFSGNGRLVASASGNYYVPEHKDDSVRLWDAATGRELCYWPAADAVLCAAMSPQGDRLVYGDRAGNVGILQVRGETVEQRAVVPVAGEE